MLSVMVSGRIGNVLIASVRKVPGTSIRRQIIRCHVRNGQGLPGSSLLLLGIGFGTVVMVVPPSLKASSVKEVIALARSKPRQLTFASSGTGGLIHLTGELFKQMAGVWCTCRTRATARKARGHRHRHRGQYAGGAASGGRERNRQVDESHQGRQHQTGIASASHLSGPNPFSRATRTAGSHRRRT